MLNATAKACKGDRELKLVQVLVRHGCRAPIRKGCYPLDPYKNADYFPYSNGCLTNKGKFQLYNVGVELRKKYCSYLSSMYHPDDIEVISSDTDRTKTSAMLMSAGLYPPTEAQKWHRGGMDWLPIPFSYTPFSEDALLVGPLARSSKYRKMFKNIAGNEYGRQVLNKHCADLLYLSEHTGIKNISIFEVYTLYQTLKAEVGLGFELPEWTAGYYPKKIDYLASYQYIFETFDISMMRESGGTFAQRIVQECQDKMRVRDPTTKKIILYAAHESTVGYQLRILDIFDQTVPPYACYLIWELWKSGYDYSVDIYYQDYKKQDPELKKTIPWEDYLRKMGRVFPAACVDE